MALRFHYWLIGLALVLSSLSAAQAPAGDDPGLEAYRAGDYESAKVLWERDLEASLDPLERARLCHNLGNCAYRLDQPGEALGWYHASLRLRPRDTATWHNLELVRSDLSLAPRDDGSLSSTLGRVSASLTLGEARWLVLGAVGLLALLLLLEAVRGGALWRALGWVGFGLLLITCVPWYRTESRSGGRPVVIVQEGGASARAEPRTEAKTIQRLPFSEEFEQLDSIPGWTRLEVGDEQPLWVSSSAVFDVAR